MSVSRRLAVATALGTVAAGLVSGATTGTAHAGTDSSRDAHRVKVLVKADHSIVMPRRLSPGVTTFRIGSRRAATFQVVQAAKGYTKREAARDTNAAFNKNDLKALKRFEANLTLLGGVASKPRTPATMSVDLESGHYWAVDVQPSKLDPTKILNFRVVGDWDSRHGDSGRLSGQVIRAVDATSWGKATPRITTHGEIHFQNLSTENHFLEVVRLAKGKTMKDLRQWIRLAKKGKQAPPPIDESAGVSTGVISPGKSMSFKYRLPAGNYALLCFWPDADMGGMPHALMGMVRGLKVG